MHVTTESDADKFNIAWVDLTRSTYVTELPKTVTRSSRCERFESLDAFSTAANDEAVTGWDAVVFDFDFPQETDLAFISELKLGRLSSCPVLMMTVQHAESLAIWALRNRFLDYFVKPADTASLVACFERLASIRQLRRVQSKRDVVQIRKERSPSLPAKRKPEEKISKAIRFVENNYASDLKNRQLAEFCGMTEFRFSRVFKERYGVRFREYLIFYRLREARRLLANAEVSVTEVAYSVGFNDPSYFTRVFRKYFGKSPSDYLGIPMDAEEVLFYDFLNIGENTK